MYLYQSQSRRQMRQCFFNCLARTAHCDDYVFGVFITNIFHQFIVAPGQFSKFIHTFLNNFGGFVIKRICRLASLEIDIWILRCTTNGGLVRGHTTGTICQYQRIRNHFTQHIVINTCQAGFFVTGTESIKEMQERNARPQCCRVRDCRHIVRLLNIMRRQHRKPR